MKFLLNLFREKIGTCNLCGKTIYRGEYYGYEKDQSELALGGYFEYYFCKKCVERNCFSGSIENKIGNTFIINRRNGERSRITIRE